MNWIHCEGPGTPTVVLTANGEVHTNEEAQVYVHDLNLFVTVQLLEETPAVLAQVKTLRRPRIFLWVGQRPKTTVDQSGEDTCMQNVQLRTSRCSSVIHQFWEQFVVNIAITGLFEKRGGTSTQETGAIPRNPKPKKNEGWQEEFESPAGISSLLVTGYQRKPERNPIACIRRQFSGIRTGIFYESGKDIEEAQNSHTFRKTEIAKSACEPKWQGHHAEDALAKLYFVQKNLVTRWRQITRSSMRDVNQEAITGTLSLFKILPLNGSNLIRVKQNLHMRRRKVCRNSWSRRKHGQLDGI